MRRHVVELLAWALAQLSAQAAPTQVEVFTLSTLPLHNVRGATVYYVDAVVLLEQHLSQGLPADPQRAQALAGERMAALGAQLRSRATSGAVGVSRAVQLGVDRAPAIVFDGRWVVYGVTDVDAARQLFVKHSPAGETTR